jgi:glycosyltransferase involved in cell wall biosynthesis
LTAIVVAICTYNNAALLARTLHTLELQLVDRDLDWSVLVVDNNSSDETPRLVENVLSRGKIPRFSYVREEQQGLAHARRRALRETEAPLIAFVDDDCLLDADWVQQALSFYRTHPGAGAVGGRVRLHWEVTPSWLVRYYAPAYAQQDYGGSSRQLPNTGFTYLVGAGLVLRRSAIEASGWLDHMYLTDRKGQSLATGGDVEMVLRVRAAGYQLWYYPEMCIEHVIPKERISTDYIFRLMHSVGRADPIVESLAKNTAEILFAKKFIRFRVSLIKVLKAATKMTVSDLILRQRIAPPYTIATIRAIGELQTNWELLRSGRGYLEN